MGKGIYTLNLDDMDSIEFNDTPPEFTDYASKERGVASKKVLSKVASYLAKKHTKSGVFMFDDEDLIRRALNGFPAEDLWGVSRGNTKRLKEACIHTVLQFRECDSGWIRRNMSVNGVRLQKELFGEVIASIRKQM